MATVYYTAASLDGFIVDGRGGLDWLLSRSIDQNGHFGYEPFIANGMSGWSAGAAPPRNSSRAV